MRYKLTFLFLLAFKLLSVSKTKEKFALFYFSTHDYTTIKYNITANVIINGHKLSTKGYINKIKINYPGFDTVKVLDKHDNVIRKIITRFKKDCCYEFSRYEDKYEFEFFDANTVGIYKRQLSSISEDDVISRKKMFRTIDSIESRIETGSVTFRLLNYTDTVLAAGMCGGGLNDFTSGVVLKDNKTGFMNEANTISTIGCFFRIKMGQGKIRNENDIYDDDRYINFQYSDKEVFVLYDEWFGFEYKFFTKENLEVTYNYKTKKVSIKIK